MSMEHEKPYEMARELLSRFSNLDKVAVPVDRIARKLGAKVRYEPMDKDLSGMIFIKDGTPIIGVNSMHNDARQRYTISHELGHLLMHKAIIEKEVHIDTGFTGSSRLNRDLTSAGGTNPIEVEANKFASELLMPTRLLLDAIDTNTFDLESDQQIDGLAKKFRVSTQAMQFRIARLLG